MDWTHLEDLLLECLKKLFQTIKGSNYLKFYSSSGSKYLKLTSFSWLKLEDATFLWKLISLLLFVEECLLKSIYLWILFYLLRALFEIYFG